MAKAEKYYSEEDDRLRDFCKDGLSFNEMAQQLENLVRAGKIDRARSRDSLYSRARRLGLTTGNERFGRQATVSQRRIFLPPLGQNLVLKKGKSDV